VHRLTESGGRFDDRPPPLASALRRRAVRVIRRERPSRYHAVGGRRRDAALIGLKIAVVAAMEKRVKEMTPEQRERRLVYLKRWREGHREERLAYHKRWYEQNRERALANKKRRYEKNRERELARRKAWYEENKQRVRARQRRYDREKRKRLKSSSDNSGHGGSN
jgi:hypothetical protein